MKTGLGENRHKVAAHDLPLLSLLLSHHCILCIASYDPAIQQKHPLANAARAATEAVEELKKALFEQAKIEHQAAEWLQEYTKEYDGEEWPPRITGEAAK